MLDMEYHPLGLTSKIRNFKNEKEYSEMLYMIFNFDCIT